jgi:SAM-dependent methyltransferase
MWNRWYAIRQGRAALRAKFADGAADDESMVPSYLHGNPAAAYVAWDRLFKAVRLYRRLAAPGPVLDFGAGAGVLCGVLPADAEYFFVERDDLAARGIPGNRLEAATLPLGHFAAVFALDSLEHNRDVATLVQQLAGSLRPDGVLIVSGPTENWMYRLGRRIAGFAGDYHHFDIREIEAILARSLHPVALPGFSPLFRISAWRRLDPTL